MNITLLPFSPGSRGNRSTFRDRLLSGFVESPDGCWEWQRAVNDKGYGQSSDGGKVTYVHRAMYEIAFGPVPEGMLVCHTCDNRRCGKPSHLFAGTPLDNTQDMISKGRGILPPVHSGEAWHLARGAR